MNRLLLLLAIITCLLIHGTGCATTCDLEYIGIEGLEIVRIPAEQQDDYFMAVGDYDAKFYRIWSYGAAEELKAPYRSFGNFREMKASKDGKYLAIHSTGEGHPAIDIIDFRHYLDTGESTNIVSMSTYPGYIWMDRWEDGKFYFFSNMLCLHSGDSERGLDPTALGFRIELRDVESFVFDPLSMEIQAVSPALQDPVAYFGKQLLKGQTNADDWRPEISGLYMLGDPAGIPYLEKALERETDPDTIQWIQDLKKVLGRCKCKLTEEISRFYDEFSGEVITLGRSIDWEIPNQKVAQELVKIFIGYDSWQDGWCVISYKWTDEALFIDSKGTINLFADNKRKKEIIKLFENMDEFRFFISETMVFQMYLEQTPNRDPKLIKQMLLKKREGKSKYIQALIDKEIQNIGK